MNTLHFDQPCLIIRKAPTKRVIAEHEFNYQAIELWAKIIWHLFSINVKLNDKVILASCLIGGARSVPACPIHF